MSGGFGYRQGQRCLASYLTGLTPELLADAFGGDPLALVPRWVVKFKTCRRICIGYVQDMYRIFTYIKIQVWAIDWAEVCVCLWEKKALLLAIQHPIWYIICSQRLTSSEVKPLNQFISTVNDTGFESMMSECDIGEGWCEPTNSPEFSKYIRHITFGIPNLTGLLFWRLSTGIQFWPWDWSWWSKLLRLKGTLQYMKYMWHWFIRWKFISCDQKGTLY